MRLRIEIVTAATELPWSKVLAPGRGFAYQLLGKADPALGRRLHASGWGPHGMVPIGYSAPVFPAAPRRRGAYAVGGRGVLEFGSPLPEVVAAWAQELRRCEVLDWGGAAFRVTRVEAVDPPEFASGTARLRTSTPVVLKGAGRDDEGTRTTRQAWVLPAEPEFPAYFERNLCRKAETLGLTPDVHLEAIGWIGPKRSFVVGNGAKPGAAVEVGLRGSPEVLRAIWSWGLGQANSAGFGWIGQ